MWIAHRAHGAMAFESSGATIDSRQVADILKRPDIHYLSEMMNWPGVLHGDPEVFAKIAAAKALGKPVDGHAPQLMGADAAKYIAAAIFANTSGSPCNTPGQFIISLK